jgi:hypothetical protein
MSRRKRPTLLPTPPHRKGEREELTDAGGGVGTERSS